MTRKARPPKARKRLNGAKQVRLLGHLYSAPGLQPTVLGKRVRKPGPKS